MRDGLRLRLSVTYLYLDIESYSVGSIILRMAPRNTRRQRPQDEYLEDSNEELYKRRKVEKKAVKIENELLGTFCSLTIIVRE